MLLSTGRGEWALPTGTDGQVSIRRLATEQRVGTGRIAIDANVEGSPSTGS